MAVQVFMVDQADSVPAVIAAFIKMVSLNKNKEKNVIISYLLNVIFCLFETAIIM